MNFNYGYNVKAAQPLQAKQVEKVKEEVVEKKEAEVKADAPKYEVVTGDADKILADINKATVKGIEPKRSKGSAFENHLNAYRAAVADYEANAANLSPKEKLSKLAEIFLHVSAMSSYEEFEAQSNDFKTGIANECIRWREEGINAANEVINQMNNGLQIPASELASIDDSLHQIVKFTSFDGSIHTNVGSNQQTVGVLSDVISNYTDANMFDLKSDNLNTYANFVYAANNQPGAQLYGNTLRFQDLYQAMSDEIDNVKAGMEGKTSAEKTSILNSITSKLTDLIRHPALDDPNIFAHNTREAILSDYVELNGERDSIVSAEAEHLMHKKGEVTFEEMKNFVDLLQMIPDSVEDYELIASKLTPEQSLAFFESKYNANFGVLTVLDKYIGDQLHKLPKGIMEVFDKFNQLQDAVKIKIEEAQAAANAQ